MKAKEIFLIFVAFIMLFMIFCVVNLTGNDSENNGNKPIIRRLNSASASTSTQRTIFQGSALNPDQTPQKLKTNNSPQVAENHPVNARTNMWSSRFREFNNRENNSQLKTVISNGCVYIENTSGVEAACEEDNTNKEDIEIIE
jgi:hypothetical protein